MKTFAIGIAAVAAFGATSAPARDTGLTFNAGARAWYTDWTASCDDPATPGFDPVALTQVSAKDKPAIVPTDSFRWKNWLSSASGMPSKRCSLDDGTDGRRSGFDINAGGAMLPDLALMLGDKCGWQSGEDGRDRPGGAVLGASASAPPGSGLSMCRSLALGRRRTPSGDQIDFKANYPLVEVRLTGTLNADKPRWTLTDGYRLQVMNSKDAFQWRDGRDTTAGFTFGGSAMF